MHARHTGVHAKWRGAAGPPWHQGSKNIILCMRVAEAQASWMRKCTLVTRVCRATYPPCKSLQSGWLAHSRACQVAWGGGATLASAIEKRYIVYARCPSTSILDDRMRKCTLVTRACRATYPPCKSLQSGWLAHSMVALIQNRFIPDSRVHATSGIK